ncbi:Dolichyl-phosphate-mannose-protein mannosyltransferase-domain-containing protein [Blastocladiella britannica]|nr:Dolichyl-phosphate-mannose-protein mannosyltransferase-domain-containing protein [Blastocladiella britannica]
MADRAGSTRKRKSTKGGESTDQADSPLLQAGRPSLEQTKGHAHPTPASSKLASSHKTLAESAERSGLSNALFWIVTVLSFVTRFHALSVPDEVVFDEVHFGKFASFYLRRTFYFDVHPPLGRLMIAGWGWINGYMGHFDFKEIGDSYVENKVPYMMLRSWPAICGSLVVPLAFETLRELGFSPQACLLASIFIVFDNSLIAQSRLILLDSMLMLFITLSLYTWVKFSKTRKQPFSAAWWGWLTATGVSLGLVMGIKMVGLFTVATIGVGVLVELWYLLDEKVTPNFTTFMNHFLARAVCLIALPFALYLAWFAIHFAVLTKTGPGDNFMSPEFQATLEGNKLSGDAAIVLYGANVTMQHIETRKYLHSHLDRYPLEYEDKRISSAGQQVTCYGHADTNNVWRIKPADPEKWADVMRTDVPFVPVRHGDHVVIEHVRTQSHLLTHDVASPMMPTNQEFTTIGVDEWIKRLNETVFKFDVLHAKELVADADGKMPEGDILKTLGMRFRLIHVKSGVAMYTHSKQLPEWGFKQQEVNGNKKTKEKSNLWFIEESVNQAKDAEFAEVPKDPQGEGLKKPSFLSKFAELQSAMLSHNAALTKPHPYQSPPHYWPVIWRGISFWQDSKDKQIYLLPNPIAWWFATAMIGIYAASWALERLAERRGIYFDREAANQMHYSTGFLFVAWALHYLPFYLMGRSLFLHHYLPAAIIAAMIAGAMWDFVMTTFLPNLRRNTVQSAIAWLITLAAVGGVVFTFWFFSPMTYGNASLTKDELRSRKWLASWDFQYSG